MKVLFLLLTLIVFLYANPFQEKENLICVDYPKQIIKLSYKQLCDYGKLGCKNVKKVDYIQGLCSENTISECFSKKQWLTIEQFVNLDTQKKITNIWTKTSKTIGIKTIKKQLCVETAKKTFTMNDKKFKLYKQLSPDVLDIINNAIKKIITCIEVDISEKNLITCMKKFNKTTEATISALLPAKVSTLCVKDENNNIQFIWTKEKHLMLIKELKNKIKENKRNKECLLQSDTLNEYATCLANKSQNKTE